MKLDYSIINKEEIPQFTPKYVLKKHRYGYKVNIFHKDLVFIPERVKKFFGVYTPFSDAQRIAMEIFLINHWKREESRS